VKHSSSSLTLSLVLGMTFGLAPFAASAQITELPLRKPGMWEQKMELGSGQSMTMKMCIDEETEKQFSALGKAKAKDCSQDVQKVGDGYTFKATCAGKTVTGKATGDFDKEVKIDIESEGQHMVSNQTYLGACPADRKPGDVEMPGGQVVNMKNLIQ
jgi:hypothetical protein